MAYEAARVRRGERGAEIVDAPERFDDIHEALAYVAGSPRSNDGNRPWIRDTLVNDFRKAFVMTGGKVIAPLIASTANDIRACAVPRAENLTDAQAEQVRANLIALGYRDYVIPGPVWQRQIGLAKAEP